jgi:large subunit ribosomal protein L7A
MSYEKVIQTSEYVVGIKQTVKALKDGTIKEVLVARDASPHLTSKVISIAIEKNVPLIYVDSMMMLGKACGIEVGASTVALIR